MPLESSILPELGIVVTRASGTPSLEEIRALASVALSSPSSRRAVVAPRDAAFGLSRMHEGFSILPEGHLQVFRSRDDAMAWLGAGEGEG